MAVLDPLRGPRPLLRTAAGVPATRAALAAALSGRGPAFSPLPEGGGSADAADRRSGEADRQGVAETVALVVETSGSTGYPKRVALSAEALRASHRGSSAALGGPGQWLLALPTHYIAGAQVLIRSLLDGTEPVAVEAGPFRPAAFRAAAARLDPRGRRYTSLVPAQLQRLLEEPEAAAVLSGFDGVLVGGQRVPQSVAERAAAAGVRMVRTYGSSETAGGCVYNGEAFDGVTLRAQDGELTIAGPVLAEGYLGDPERTAAQFRLDPADGTRSYRTGDIGTIDGGLLRIEGRRDRVLISGGTNVSLERLEALLRDRDGWEDAVVLAADDERWGEVPVVFSAASIGLDEARALSRAGIGVAAQPARVIRLREMPTTSSGKPDRTALSRLLAGGHMAS